MSPRAIEADRAIWDEQPSDPELLADEQDLGGVALRHFNGGPYGTVFRGQPRHKDWPLLPKVFRLDRDPGAEQSLIADFYGHAPGRMSDPLPTTEIDWLCLAQHHGLPTRLLDWSCSLPVALAFACMGDDHSDVDGVVWALNVSRLNSRFVEGEGRLNGLSVDVRAIAKAALEGRREAAPRIAAFEPIMRFPRMLSQHSYFTIHGENTPIERLDGVKALLRPYIVPAHAKMGLTGLLRNSFGARREVLFPDLSTLGDELARQRYSNSPTAAGPPATHPPDRSE